MCKTLWSFLYARQLDLALVFWKHEIILGQNKSSMDPDELAL